MLPFLYPKYEHSKSGMHIVVFNKSGGSQLKHSFSFPPKHSEHPGSQP